MSNGFSGFGDDLAVGELDQRHVGVGAEQLVGGVAVLAGVEHRLAVDDRQEGLQLGAVPRRPDRRVAQDQEARVDAPRRRRPPPAPPRRRRSTLRADGPSPASRRLRGSARRPGNSESSGRIATSIASGAAIISALACE